MNLINHTPLHATPFLLMDHTGAENLLVVVKGTWSIGTEGALAISEEQVPIRLSPLYNGEPGSSSLRYDTDIVLKKPGTDCALIRHAWAPNTGVHYIDVTFAVGPVCHLARVFGERRWMTRRTRGNSESQQQIPSFLQQVHFSRKNAVKIQTLFVSCNSFSCK